MQKIDRLICNQTDGFWYLCGIGDFTQMKIIS